MSEQTPTNISNADFTFKDKYGNTGKTKGVSTNDSTKLNNMVKLMNLMLNTPNSTDFINTLATKQYVDNHSYSDTVPLFAPHYFDYTPNNLSWLKGGEQSNSGDLYKTCYNELVNVLNGETKYGSLKVIDQADMVSGTDYSLYWIVNQTTETFRTPTKTQQRFVVKTYQNGIDWYRIYNDGWCEQGGFISNLTFANENITFLRAFSSTPLNASAIQANAVAGNWRWAVIVSSSATGMELAPIYSQSGATPVGDWYWFASGYIDLTNETFDTSLYFKVANAVENIQMLDVGEVTEALTSKADVTLANTSNVAQAFKNAAISWGLPDWSTAINISGSSSYTATYKCWLVGAATKGGNVTVYVTVNGIKVARKYNDYCQFQIPLDVGDTAAVTDGGVFNINEAFVVRMKGAN